METLIFTPREGVTMDVAIAALHRRDDVTEIIPLPDAGVILGQGDAASIAALRALPEFRAVDFDQPVHTMEDPAG